MGPGETSALSSMKRLLDYDPIRGVSCYFEQDSSGAILLHHEQDVESILEANKRQKSIENLSNKGIKKGMWHYGCVPDVILMKWTKEVGSDILASHNRKEFFKRLNSPEYSHLRTTYGRHRPKA